MEDVGNTVKRTARAMLPQRLLDVVWAKYLAAKSKTETTVAGSLVDSPRRMKAIRRTYAARNNESDFLTIDWLNRRIKELDSSALRTYFVMDAEGHTPALCAPQDCYRALVDAVIAVSVQSNLQLTYVLEERTITITNYPQLQRDLNSKAFVEIRLGTEDRQLAVYLERWHIDENTLLAPQSNPITRKIHLRSPSASVFLDEPGAYLANLYPDPLLEECTFEVDVVYTWVNYEDTEWQKMLAQHSGKDSDQISESSSDTDKDLDPDRFTSRDELKHSLRSLLKFAPWVRNVFILTNCAPPDWFDETNERVKWVYHDEVIDPAHLPTFSSHAIEASVHLVPNLSEHFLYFNDDLFLVKPVSKSDFFLPNGIPKIRPEPYGIVHGEIHEDDPDYLNAARNVQQLLAKHFGKTATRLHTHSPQSMRLSIVRECEQMFKDAYERTRGNRFRAISDISPTSFMYPSFAYVTGRAIMDYPEISLVNHTKTYQKTFNQFQNFMTEGNHEELPLTVCINDGGGSTGDEKWGDAVTRFITAAFDEMSEAERPYGIS